MKLCNRFCSIDYLANIKLKFLSIKEVHDRIIFLLLIDDPRKLSRVGGQMSRMLLVVKLTSLSPCHPTKFQKPLNKYTFFPDLLFDI